MHEGSTKKIIGETKNIFLNLNQNVIIY